MNTFLLLALAVGAVVLLSKEKMNLSLSYLVTKKSFPAGNEVLLNSGMITISNNGNNPILVKSISFAVPDSFWAEDARYKGTFQLDKGGKPVTPNVMIEPGGSYSFPYATQTSNALVMHAGKDISMPVEMTIETDKGIAKGVVDVLFDASRK